MEIHMLLGYAPYVGYDIAKKLLENKVIDTCDISSWNMNYAVKFPGITYYDQEDIRYADYSRYVDINNTPSLSRELLEAMLPYESMCIKLGRRGCNFPSVEYEYEKQKYHTHLRFWNYIFENKSINAVYFDQYPHNFSSDYIIYCLAMIKKIPILMVDISPLSFLRVFATNFDNFGYLIEQYYNNLQSDKNILVTDLKEPIRTYYTTKKDKLNNIMEPDLKAMEKERKATEKQYFGPFVGWKTPLRYFKFFLYDLWNKGDTRYYKKFFRDYRFVKYYKQHLICTSKTYNKIAKYPDYSNKYIYFGLQVDPEATTTPLAGVFCEQYTSLELLSRIVRGNEIKIYVKEHYLQPFRDINFYHRIMNLDNVELIRTDVSAFELTKNALAVATQTGSCVLESAIARIPALVFSSGYNWKGIPNCYEIRDEDQGRRVLEKILNGVDISEFDILRYFYSIQETCIAGSCIEKWSEDYGEEVKVMVGKTVDSIETELLSRVKGIS